MDDYPHLNWWFAQPAFWDKFCAWVGWLDRLLRRKRDPWPPRCRPALELLEKRWLPSSGISEYTVPTAASSPTNMTLGPDNNVWFVENAGNKIAKITTAGSFTEYGLNTGYSAPFDVTTGPDANLWFTESGVLLPGAAFGKSTTGGSITDYSVPGVVGNATNIASTLGADGSLYFHLPVDNKIGKLTTGGTYSLYTIPTMSAGNGDITLGPDGNLWFTEQAGNKIGRMTPSGTFTEWAVPTTLSEPLQIVAGPDGNLWFTENAGNNIGRITSDGNGNFTEWTVPTAASSPDGITVGADHNLWFAENATDKIGRLALDGTFTEWALAVGSAPTDIIVGGDKQIWFTETGTNKIAKLAWAPTPQTRSDDPVDRTLTPFGPALVSPQTGDVQLKVPLDFEDAVLTVPDCGCIQDTWATVVADPTLQAELVNNGTSVNEKPIVEVTLPSDAEAAVPTSIDAVLTWNNGSPQAAINFSTSGHSAGDVYDVALQVSSAVTSTGYYPWKVDVTYNFTGGDTITRSITGNLAVVVNGTGATDGQGWSIGGVVYLPEMIAVLAV